MKPLQKKRNIDNTHHQIQSIKVPLQVRPFAEPQEQTQSIFHGLNNFIKMITDILLVSGVGGIPALIIKTAQGVLKFVAVAIGKIKCFVKIITGRRGVNRLINAEHIVEAAFKGNPRALQLLVDLDPIRVLFRALGPTGKKQLIKKHKNTEEMMEILQKISRQPKKYETQG